MSADKLIARLDQMGLLDEQVLAELRQQIAESKFPISADNVAQRLIDEGHITANQAKKLLSGLVAAPAPAPKPVAAPSKPPAPKPSADDDMGLLPDDEVEKPKPPPAKPAPAPSKPAPPKASADDDMGLMPEDGEAAPKPQPVKPAAAAPKKPAPPKASDDDDMGLVPEEGEAAPKPSPAKPAAPAPSKPTPIATKPAQPTVPKTSKPAGGAAVKTAPKKTEEAEEIILLEDATSPAASSGLTPLRDTGLTPLAKSGPAAPGKPAVPGRPTAPTKAKTAAPAPSGLTPLGDTGLTPLGDTGLTPLAASGLTPVAKSKPTAPTKPKVTPPASSGLTPLASEGLTPVGGEGLTPLADSGGLTALDDGGGLTPFGGDGSDGLTSLGAGSTGGGLDAFASAPTRGGPPSGPAPGAPAKPLPRIKKQKGGEWDSPRMLLGGGALLLLIFVGIILVYNLTRGNADEIFEKAETEYKGQAYDVAVKLYEKFLTEYPTHDKASLVRVRRGLARLRQVVDQAKDMKGALELAKTMIPEIENENRFADGRDELGAMLPKIAEDFATRAKSAQPAKAAEYVALGEQAMELINNPSYIPAQLRESRQRTFETIRENLDEAKRTIQQDKALSVAREEMKTALKNGDTPQAFEIRRKLLKEFPGVENDAKLGEIVLEVSAKERELVKIDSTPFMALKEEDDAATAKSVLKLVFSHRKGETAAGLENEIAFVLARGSIFGIEVSTGKILWRRFVGFETLIDPQKLGKETGADALVVDARRKELLRLNAKTGKIVWRLSVGEPFAPPAQPGKQLIVTTASGRLIEVDPETGDSGRSVLLPQATSVGAGGDSRFPTFFQVGDDSNLYVISSDTLECKEVFYLGHKSGTIAVPPVIALDHLFIVENAGANFAVLHILKSENGLGLKAAQESIRLTGNVTTPMVQIKKRVALLTNLGEARVFEVDKTREKEPVKEVAKQVATAQSPEPGHIAASENVVWIAGNRLTAYDIQASRTQLNGKWAKHEGEPFIAPLQHFGQVLVHVRRRRGSLGVTVAASKADSGDVIWRTDIGVPAAYLGSGSTPGQFVLINSHGDLYRTGGAALKAGYLEKPTESVEVEGSEMAYTFGDAGPLGDGRVVLSNQMDRRNILFFDPERQKDTVRVIRLATGERAPALAPQPFAGGVIAPLDNGTITYFNAENGKPRSHPFQPRLEPGVVVEWQPAAIAGADRKDFVITDSRRKIYRVGLREMPEPHLAAIGEMDAPESIDRPLAVAGDTLYAVSRDTTDDVVLSFVRSSLAAGQQFKVKGRITAGPWQVGDAVIMVAEGEGVICFGSGQKQRWTQPLAHGTLAGPPIADAKSFIFTSQQGSVWRAGFEDGQETVIAELNETLSGTAAPYGPVLLLTTTDGTLIAVREKPQP